MDELLKACVVQLTEVLTFLEKNDFKGNQKKEKEKLVPKLVATLESCKQYVSVELHKNISKTSKTDTENKEKSSSVVADIGLYEDNVSLLEEKPIEDIYEEESYYEDNVMNVDDLNKIIIKEELEFKKESLLKISWKRRLCVVKTDKMYIFETSKDTQPKQTISLKDHQVFIGSTDIIQDPKRKDKCFFLKNTNSGKIFEFCAKTVERVNAWKVAIDSFKGTEFSKDTILPKKTSIIKNKDHETEEETYDDVEFNSDNLIVYEDYLFVKSSSRLRPWQKKMCILRHGLLEVYETVKGFKQLKQTFKIDNCRFELNTSKKDFAFNIVEKGNLFTIELASMEENFFNWKKHFYKVLDENNFKTEEVYDDTENETFGNNEKKYMYNDVVQKNSSPQSPTQLSLSPCESITSEEDEVIDFTAMYLCMWDCEADEDNELSFKRGDILKIISTDHDCYGWWEAKLNSVVGFVPKNFLMNAYDIQVK